MAHIAKSANKTVLQHIKNRHRGGNHDGGNVNQQIPLKPIYLDIIPHPADRCKLRKEIIWQQLKSEVIPI